MAVLIEAISVVVLKSAVENEFFGGMDAFLQTLPNGEFCMDDNLARVGFMDTSDADTFIAVLEASGLKFGQDDGTPDGVIVIQNTGPLVTTEWLTFANIEQDGMKLSVCWHAEAEPGSMAVPRHWKYEKSLSASGPGFAHRAMIGERLKFLRREGNIEVYLDLQTNKELYTARPTIGGNTPGALQTQIAEMVHEVFEIEAKGPIAKPRFWRRPDPRYTRLTKELLPELQRIANGPGREMMAAHFGLAVVLRALGRLPEQECCLRRAHELNPESAGVLKDLVQCLGGQGRPREALPFAREAAHLDPTNEGILGNLAACLMQCGECNESMRVIAQALEINPDDKINLHIRDTLRQHLGVNDP